MSSIHNVTIWIHVKQQQHASIRTYLQDNLLGHFLMYPTELVLNKGDGCNSLRDSEGTRRSDNEAHLSMQ